MQQVVRAIPFILLLVAAVIAFIQDLTTQSAAAIANALTYAICVALGAVIAGLFCASIGYLFGDASGWPNNFKQVWRHYMGIAALLLIVAKVIPM
jgi:hypothetical protein